MPVVHTLANLATALNKPADPLVTYYDQATGERTELSGITMSNWVAKTSNFLVDELDAQPGTRIRLGLPAHWLRFVWILSAFNTGTVLVESGAQIAVTGPDLTADEPQRVASSLLPFAARFTTPPDGFFDMGIEIAAQPDQYIALDPPEPETLAVDFPGPGSPGPRTHQELLAATQPDDRRLMLLADVPGASSSDLVQRDISTIISACLGNGSVVLVSGADADQVVRLADQEGAEQSGTIH